MQQQAGQNPGLVVVGLRRRTSQVRTIPTAAGTCIHSTWIHALQADKTRRNASPSAHDSCWRRPGQPLTRPTARRELVGAASWPCVLYCSGRYSSRTRSRLFLTCNIPVRGARAGLAATAGCSGLAPPARSSSIGREGESCTSHTPRASPSAGPSCSRPTCCCFGWRWRAFAREGIRLCDEGVSVHECRRQLMLMLALMLLLPPPPLLMPDRPPACNNASQAMPCAYLPVCP